MLILSPYYNSEQSEVTVNGTKYYVFILDVEEHHLAAYNSGRLS